MRVKLWGYFLLLCLLVFVWSPGLRAPYLFDDYAVPVSDPASQSLQQWAEGNLQTLRPITKLSFALESEAGLTQAPQRRIFNVIILLSLAALIFAFLAGESDIGLMAFLGVGIFLVHPLHADNFILLAGRSALLAEFFLLCSFYSYIKQKNIWVVVFALLAVLARETAILAAVLLILLAFQQWPLPRFKKGAALSLALLATLLPFASEHFRELLQFSQDYVASSAHLGLQLAGFSRGFVWIFLPVGLSIDHDFSVFGIERLVWILASLVLILSTIVLFWQQRTKARLAFLLAVLVVLPTQSLIAKLDPLTERPFATALPFVLLGLIWSLPRALKLKSVRCIAAAFIVILGGLTWQRGPKFCDEISIWQEASEASKTATRPLVNLGTLLAQQKRYDEALLALEKAKLRNPIDIEIQEKINAIHVLKQTFEE